MSTPSWDDPAPWHDPNADAAYYEEMQAEAEADADAAAPDRREDLSPRELRQLDDWEAQQHEPAPEPEAEL